MDRYGTRLPTQVYSCKPQILTEICYPTTCSTANQSHLTLKPSVGFPDVFFVPNGPRTDLQQPVHEPVGPTRPPWRHEPRQHGFSHEQPQHEWPSDGHEPGSYSRHGAFRGSRPKDASAGVSRGTSAGHANAGDEEAISWGGEWKDLMIKTTRRKQARFQRLPTVSQVVAP